MIHNMQNIRAQFPQLQEKVYGKALVYLDNAATSLRPQSVIDCWQEMALRYNANVHRAVHKTASEATLRYEAARKAVAAHIGAASEKEIVFTSGDTAALNLVARCFGTAFIGEGEEIIVAQSEHHSNLVPWQMICKEKGAVLKCLPVDESGHLQIELLPQLLSERTKLVCVADISNVLGLRNPVAQIVRLAHEKGCPVLLDGAQGIVHENIDVQALDCDFYTFSGHKVYAAPGTGVLYAKRKWLEAMPPYMGGGEMIESVAWEGSTYAAPPYRFEAGTPNIAGVPTLVPSREMARLLNSADIAAEADAVRDFVLESLSSIPGLRLFGVPADRQEKLPIFSFTVEGAHHEDLALLLDKMGIAVRSGQMCAEPLMTRFGVTGMLRASFAPYNTMEEAEFFVASLKKAISMLI